MLHDEVGLPVGLALPPGRYLAERRSGCSAAAPTHTSSCPSCPRSPFAGPPFASRSKSRTWTGARSCRPSRTSAPAETSSKSRWTSWRQVRAGRGRASTMKMGEVENFVPSAGTRPCVRVATRASPHMEHPACSSFISSCRRGDCQVPLLLAVRACDLRPARLPAARRSGGVRRPASCLRQPTIAAPPQWRREAAGQLFAAATPAARCSGSVSQSQAVAGSSCST